MARRVLALVGIAVLFGAVASVILWRSREEPPRPSAQLLPQPGAGPGAGDPQDPGSGPAPAGVAALVNGEPIRSAEVDAAIDRDSYGLMLDEARKARLDRLVAIAAIRQHLAAQGIKVADEEVKKEVDELRRNPPAAGCSCCRYNSLAEFLSANTMTLKDLEASIRNDLGLERHATALWTAEHPAGEKRDALLAKERARIGRDYVKLAHIFFNTAQQPDFQVAPDQVRETVRAKAAAAWKRLEKGEDFAKLARECSEDTFSRPKGGDLGCVVKAMFGRNVEAAVDGLKPGAYSAPVESPWGFHILRRAEMGDPEILEALQAEYKERKVEEVSSSAQSRAKVERFDKRPGKE